MKAAALAVGALAGACVLLAAVVGHGVDFYRPVEDVPLPNLGARVFLSDGPEPPADVRSLEWLDVREPDTYPFLIRIDDGWLWSMSPTQLSPAVLATPNSWRGAVGSCDGRYREVV